MELPLATKYLLLAAYVASRNSKESDDVIFALRKKGKRKRTHAGMCVCACARVYISV